MSVDRERLAAARMQFLDGRDGGPRVDGVPTSVVASWRRSRSAGVLADVYRAPYDADVDLDSRLVRCAVPVVARLVADLADIPVSIAITDARARIVHRRDCSSAVGRVLDRVDFTTGFSFAEGGVGTNGIGTVLASGAAVSVVGPAHFSESLLPFACTGAPVVDPVTGRVEGVLDASLLAGDWTPVIHALVRGAAADIGRALLADRGEATRALVDRFLSVDARTRHAVLAVGDTVIANRAAQQLLTPDEQAVVHQHARSLVAGMDAPGGDLELGDGRVLHLTAVPVHCGDRLAGVVLTVTEAPPRAQGPGPPRAAADTCPAWRRAADDLRSALQDRSPVLVVGEPGAGKARLVGDVLQEVRPGVAPVVVDAADLPGALPAAGPAAVLVVRRLETLPVAGVASLRALVGAPGGPQLCATLGLAASQTWTGLPCAELLPSLGTTVRVPALRHRGGDLPALVRSVLAELAPGRRVPVAPAVERVLRACPWPGNLTQLRAALAVALDRRPVGELQVEDLPGSCRTSSTRVLTPIQVAERDTIVTALTAAGGNRVRASAALGLSRSSLYRKLEAYGVVEV